MATYISVLPSGILEVLATQLDKTASTGPEQQTASGLSLLRLPHPRTGLLSLFLPARSTNSILEVQNVAPNASRSWFMEGEVVSDGGLLVMTPVDTAFLLVPFLRAVSPKDGSMGNFRTLDDIFEDAAAKLARANDSEGKEGEQGVSTDVYLSAAVELGCLPCVQEAMRRVCEVKDIASDLVVYRYSQPRFIDYLVKKVTRLSQNGVVEKSRTLERELTKDGLMDDGNEELLQSGRLKLACDLISQYVPPDIHQELLSKFDFAALAAHVSSLQAVSLHETTTATGIAQKAQALSDEKELDAKKRKAAVQSSRGVEKLKKASVKGMAKLS
ncbi:hypothetical protein M0805_000734, partial [Coniferiporia weirii]